ncbi:BamA/TamA family outer membrane protein [bacterium]|nr:BamA/TamA family outer membrane protein [bacterium]
MTATEMRFTDWKPIPWRLSIAGNRPMQWVCMGCILWMCLWGSFTVHAEASPEPEAGPVIDTVIVRGNHLTKPFVILNEISLAHGIRATDARLKENRDRLNSLNLFSRVELSTDSAVDTSTLQINVTELWYIWPGFYLSVEEEDWTRSTYGLRVEHFNFRGRRESLSVSTWTGGADGGLIEWQIPYLFQGKNWYMEWAARANFESDPLYIARSDGLNTRHASLYVETGRWLDLQRNFGIRLGVEMLHFTPLEDGSTVNATSGDDDRLGVISFHHALDTRHYQPWADQGYYAVARVEFARSLDGPEIAYIRPSFSLSRYIRISNRFIIAGQGRVGYTFGDSPAYRRYISNRTESLIRTGRDRLLEGNRFGRLSLEWRSDLLERRYFGIPMFDPVNDYTRDLFLGISHVFFADLAGIGGADETANDPTGAIDKDGWDLGYGTAVVLHIPYLQIVRFEVARSARFPDDGITFRARIGAMF